MKKFISILLAITTLTIALIVYEKYFVQSEFGPSAMLAVSLLLCFALALLITLLTRETKYNETVTHTWLVLTSMFVTYLIVDLLAGLLLIVPLSPTMVPGEFRHHKLLANTNSKFEQKEFSYIQRVNNLGIRGKDRLLEKPSNHHRILMLGDSFTMGKGVEDNQTFSNLLEQSLNEQKACKSKTIEVLNGGIDSYAPILSNIQLKRDLAPTNPDAIVLNLDTNDLLQEQAYRKIATRDASGRIIGVPGYTKDLLLSQRIRIWIDQNLYITRLALFYTNKFLGHKDLTVEGVVTKASYDVVPYTIEGDTVDREQQWKDIFESILEIKKFADERSISFTLVHYPWGHLVSDKEYIPGRYQYMPEDAVPTDKYLKILYRLSKKNGIEFINVFPSFRAYKGDKPLYYKYDGHFTAEGHKVMAGRLEQYLVNKYSTEWCK